MIWGLRVVIVALGFALGYAAGRAYQTVADHSTVGAYADWCKAQGGLLTRIEERGGVTYCSYKLELKGDPKHG